MKEIIAAVVGLTVAACGCANSQDRRAEGAVVGGVVGAGAGAIIGHQSKHAGQGAMLGGVLGALTGTLVGSQMKKPQAQEANLQQVSVDEIVSMTGQGVSDDVIIDRIQATNSRFSLTSPQVELLKQKGVSQRVIDAMQGA